MSQGVEAIWSDAIGGSDLLALFIFVFAIAIATDGFV